MLAEEAANAAQQLKKSFDKEYSLFGKADDREKERAIEAVKKARQAIENRDD